MTCFHWNYPEIPNDAYFICLSIKFGYADWMILDNNKKATLYINMPYESIVFLQ